MAYISAISFKRSNLPVERRLRKRGVMVPIYEVNRAS